MAMTPTLSVIHEKGPGPPEVALSKLARYAGVDAEFVDFRALASSLVFGTSRLALTARSLESIILSGMLPMFKRLVNQNVSHLLITAFAPNASHSQAIREFTDGRIVSVSRAMGKMRPYAVSKRFGKITGPLTGLSLTPVAETDSVFESAEGGSEIDEIIAIGGRGQFVKTGMGKCTTYLLGSAPLDIDMPVSETPRLMGYFSSLFPVLMFLRQAFGPLCWHQVRNQATLTIDDPLLTERYGFVHYQELLRTMDRYNFFTTIAFIPWNFRRTSPPVARLLHTRNDRISVCVHGCDHTRHELASPDHGELNGRVKLATIRMTEHQRLTGLPFDRVMVFPQGAFSSSCMEVLKANNYLAAVNLETTPVHTFESVPLRAFLEPALTCFGNFPLFGRRYPEDFRGFALDLFLHKPALILEHHDFFQKRGVEAIQSIKRINRLNATIRWGGLDDILARSYLQKREQEEVFSVRAFTARTRISNEASTKREYLFSKEEKDPGLIEKVTVNGKERPYDYTEPSLSLPLTVSPGATTEVEIMYRDVYPSSRVEDSFYRNLRVFSRRHLSEIRDNYLSRNRAVMAVANRMKRLFL